MPTKKKVTLADYFESIEDPRSSGRNLRHPLINILVTAVIGIACGQKTFTAIADFVEGQKDWFARYLDMSQGVPCDDTYRRVFEAISPEQFEKGFSSWAAGLADSEFAGVISVDGKTIRNSGARGESPVHLVSAWAADSGLVLGQLATPEKSNEITAIPMLLESLMLKGCIVTIDAMGCQKAIAAKIVERQADYVLALKGNQATLEQAAEQHFTAHLNGTSTDPLMTHHEETERSHGRTTKRSCWVTSNVDVCPKKSEWSGLRSLIRIDSQTTRADKSTFESRYFISSLSGTDARHALQAVRTHWHIENRLHWCLDVTLGEDQAHLRLRTLAENVSVARRIAMNVLRKMPSFTGNLAQTGRLAAFNLKRRDELVKSMV